MANFSVEKYKRGLARIPPAVKRQSFLALIKGADRMLGAMRLFVPKEDRALEKSIRAEQDPSLLRITLKAGGPSTTRPVRRGVKTTYDYALAQEFGTANHQAQPYFWPGYRLFRKQTRAAVNRAMKKAIREHFGK